MKNRDILLKRLTFRSTNRGCKETDYIFTDFALNELSKLTESELSDYAALLEIDDSTIYKWFTNMEDISPTYDTTVFSKIRTYNENRFKNIAK
ncbi:MAG: hypothetical protein K0R73_493 [Candidatus Midichloriaceae bacterium]|jgi:antitoxin CptB|nr:hypothetical protein [Candidatus Midichloriaceae bacterium]